MAKLGYQQAQQKQFARQAEKLRKLRERYSIPVASLAGWAQSDRQQEHSSRYAAYLASEHWRQFRLNLLAAEGGRCQDCQHTGLRVQVHHLHYNSVGHEQRQDVLVLCRDCHAKRHNSSSSSAEHLVRRIPPVMPREPKHFMKRKSRTAGRGR